MGINFRGSSEQAILNRQQGIETEPILNKIAAAHGVKVQKLLTSKFTDLREDELMQVMRFTSAVLPKDIERLMIDSFRNNRKYLNELLFNHNARSATTLANKYYDKYVHSVTNPVYDRGDFLSAARYGLWQAAERFDLDRTWNGISVKFLTFATPWMFRYIMELFYKKVNMITVQSLDSSPYGSDGDNAMTLGEMIGEDDIVDKPSKSASDEDDEEEEEQTDSLMGCADTDDIDNSEYVDDEAVNLIDSDENVSKSMNNVDEDSVDDERAREYMSAIKQLVKADLEQLDKQVVLEAMDDLCRTITSIRDPQEKIITLFISKRYIQHAIRKVGSECSQSVITVMHMLKGLPPSKGKLFECLHLDSNSFNKLCNKYSAKYSRKYAE